VAGWDWIQPIRDRNTGIWDKVYIEQTGAVDVRNPHVVTLVPGVRKPAGTQDDAILKVSTELANATARRVTGTVSYTLEGKTVSQAVTLEAGATKEIALPDQLVKNPKLWWPTGYGEQNLYAIDLRFVEKGQAQPSDTERVSFGVREIQTEWNPTTRSKQFSVNGQKIFIKGGNWIISDALLRFSRERYDAEIRYHRDMNLNLIRIWGGAITERPEFYEACDKYGLLVIQDFWFSGDCNGRWDDPMKAEEQWVRRKYPDNHALAVESAEDMIKMIRNHPSLTAWCGGNEIMPPADILIPLRDEMLPRLDGTRWFIDYSNSDEWSYNFLGSNGDGPYTIQPIETFWEKQTWPFNSEVGSVGVGDYESLRRFIPEANLVAPVYDPTARFKEITDSVWTYHTYTGVGYEGHIVPYGEPKDIQDFARKAQLVNYNQYRALMEGFSSHIWEWYTGSIIWKTQNPWTSMRGQMYDYYLDPNAALFGLRKGSEPVHIMCNPATKRVMIVNNSFEPLNDLMVTGLFYDIDSKATNIYQEFIYIGASQAKKTASLEGSLKRRLQEKGGFFYLRLQNDKQETVSENFYWFPDGEGIYSGLQELKSAAVTLSAKRVNEGRIAVTLSNPATNPVAFFNRLALEDKATGERILPAFYDDNYLSLLPGMTKVITVDYTPQAGRNLQMTLSGWNVKKQTVAILSE
jgi:hypothetical protein